MAVGGTALPQLTGNLGSSGVTPYLSTAQTGLTPFLTGQLLNPSSNQYLQQYYNAAAQPLIQNYQMATSPDILGGAVQSGNLYSSAPQQQQSTAQNQLANALGNLSANIYEPAYAQGLSATLQGISQEPSIAQSQYLPAQMLGQVGSQQQQLQQQIMNWPMQALSGASGLVGPTTGGAGGATSITTPGSQGGMK